MTFSLVIQLEVIERWAHDAKRRPSIAAFSLVIQLEVTERWPHNATRRSQIVTFSMGFNLKLQSCDRVLNGTIT